MKYLRWLEVLIFVGGIGLSLGAVEPKATDPNHMVMTNWTDRDGLPSNTVLDAIQDHAGWIWIASPDGLIRFDGMNFTIWSKSNSDEFASLSARVLTLTPDGTLWIGTNTDGLYAWSKGSFSHFTQDAGLPDLSISALSVDLLGRLWVGTGKGISYLKGGRFHSVPSGPEMGIPTLFLPQSDGTMLAASNLPGLWRVLETGIEGAFSRLGKRDRDSLGASVFSAAWRDPNNRLWLGTRDGRVLRVSGSDLSVVYAPAALRGTPIKAFFADRGGTLWIGSDRGIILFRDGQFQTYTEGDGLPNNHVSFMFQDRESNIWVGSEKGGISKFTASKFSNYTRRDGLVNSVVNTVCRDQFGSLWIGTDAGLSFQAGPGDPYQHDRRRKTAVDKVVDDLDNVRLRHIRFDSHNRLWFSSYSFKGLAVFDGQKLSYLNQKDGLPSNRIRKTIADKLDQLWIVTSAGLVRKSDKIKVFGNKDGLAGANILDVFQDSAGTIWVATDGDGVARLDGETFSRIGPADGLASSVVFRIYEDSAKRLWFAGSEGLSLWQNGVMHPITARLGLATDTVFQVLEEIPGRLWLLTGRGVLVVDATELADLALAKRREAPEQRFLDTVDGLAGSFSDSSWAYQDSGGIVYLPTNAGLSIFDPKQNEASSQPPLMAIESIEIDDQRLSAYENKLSLRPGVRRITIDYTALSFVAPQKLHFRYRLQGYDPSWIDAENQRSISYTNLSPGNYHFIVQAWNNDGKFDEKGAQLELHQEANFWQTIWFWMLLAAIFGAGGWLANSLRVRTILAQRHELDTLIKARTLELAHERKRSDGLLLNLLPERAVRELEDTGRITPVQHMKVSVVSANLVDFSRLSSTLGPEQTIDELNDIFAGFDEIVHDHGGERVKTIGDSYLAVTGLDREDDDHAIKICTAAVEMMLYLQRRHKPGLPAWKLRIGIASGSLVAGVVGVKKFTFDVFGEAVGLARLMERRSVPQGVTVAPSTQALTKNHFTFVERAAIHARIKPELKPFFLQYRKSQKTDYLRDGASALAQIRQMLDSQDYQSAMSFLRQLDFSVMEPDIGYAIWKIGGKCAYLAGKPELAIGSWQNALQYGIEDRALEQNLTLLRKR